MRLEAKDNVKKIIGFCWTGRQADYVFTAFERLDPNEPTRPDSRKPVILQSTCHTVRGYGVTGRLESRCQAME